MAATITGNRTYRQSTAWNKQWQPIDSEISLDGPAVAVSLPAAETKETPVPEPATSPVVESEKTPARPLPAVPHINLWHKFLNALDHGYTSSNGHLRERPGPTCRYSPKYATHPVFFVRLVCTVAEINLTASVLQSSNSICSGKTSDLLGLVGQQVNDLSSSGHNTRRPKHDLQLQNHRIKECDTAVDTVLIH